MLTKILIANRGEIACRIIRTASKLGVATVAVYSDADAKALHVTEAGEAVHIGPSPAPESYLRGDKIIAAARATGAQGIHPGYGFLSENADFADAVMAAGLKFIGPTAAAMRALGGKAAAKDIAIKAGVPVVPGYQGAKQDAKTLAAEGRKIGYPVMIKAVAGGGGRGMRLVETEADLAELLASAQREAESAFGNAHVLIEKVVVRPRHIEVQVFGDSHGNVVHLFERDCTLQRRNQKVFEEAPAPGMSPELREKMCAAAVKLAKSVGYEGAGTVEFLVEGGTLGPDAKWYFIEMNTRLQVEHPVTEQITGLDLVEWQLRVASGEKLPLTQDKIKMSGAAIEVRLCAEDPAKDFLPSVGKIEDLQLFRSAATRNEFGVRAGDAVSPYYDSMIGKIIVSAPGRGQALERLDMALAKTALFGLQTNCAFLRNLARHPKVVTGDMDTGLIGRELTELSQAGDQSLAVARGVAALLVQSRDGDRPGGSSSWDAMDAFQLGGPRRMTVRTTVNGEAKSFWIEWPRDDVTRVGQQGNPQSVEITRSEAGSVDDIGLRLQPGRVLVVSDGVHTEVARPTYDASTADDGNATDAIRAPINGKVARIFVAEGDSVVKGARIAVVEAMKMEHVLAAQRDGTIAKVAAKEGQQVVQGTLIAALAEIT